MSEEAFHVLTVFAMATELIFKWFLLSGCIYILLILFCIEPLIVHLYLNDIVLI
jgi:hypothetical protein